MTTTTRISTAVISSVIVDDLDINLNDLVAIASIPSEVRDAAMRMQALSDTAVLDPSGDYRATSGALHELRALAFGLYRLSADHATHNVHTLVEPILDRIYSLGLDLFATARWGR